MNKKKGKKPAFVVDANIYYKDFRDKYKKKANFYSVAEVIGRSSSVEDPEIFEKCVTTKKHVITQNYKHFKKIKLSKPNTKVGVIGICTQNYSKAIDQFGNVLKYYRSHIDFEGKLIEITSTRFKENK
jgi:hypothetical protein